METLLSHDCNVMGSTFLIYTNFIFRLRIFTEIIIRILSSKVYSYSESAIESAIAISLTPKFTS